MNSDFNLHRNNQTNHLTFHQFLYLLFSFNLTDNVNLPIQNKQESCAITSKTARCEIYRFPPTLIAKIVEGNVFGDHFAWLSYFLTVF